MRGHIVAMGGGGFLAGDPASPLDDLLLELAGRGGRTSSFSRRQRAIPIAPSRPSSAPGAARDCTTRRRLPPSGSRTARPSTSRPPTSSSWRAATPRTCSRSGALHGVDSALRDALGGRRRARRRLGRRQLLVRGMRDRLVLGRARRPPDGLGLPRRAATAPTSTARSAAAPSTRASSPTASRPGSRATTERRRCIAGPSSSRSSPTAPERSATASRRPATSRIATRLLA